MPRRTKPVLDSPVYTTSELMARHRVSRRTLRRWTKLRGFAAGWQSGRNVVYAKAEVTAWELKHTPHLHAEGPKSDDDKKWDLMRRRYLLEKEEREAGIAPPPKPKRAMRVVL